MEAVAEYFAVAETKYFVAHVHGRGHRVLDGDV
jgi:hypothetical protein